MAVLADEPTPGLDEFKAKLQKVTDLYSKHKDDLYGARKVMKEIQDREMVNHPDHYQGKKMEVINVIEDYDLGFSLGNAIKYILRADAKGNRKQDLKKAIWYIQREIDREDV